MKQKNVYKILVCRWGPVCLFKAYSGRIIKQKIRIKRVCNSVKERDK